jgi:hypothetical protein
MSDLAGKPPAPKDIKATVSQSGESVIKSSGACGLDVGTMNLVSAFVKNDEITTKSMRNVFLHLDKDSIGTLDLSGISHVFIDEELYVLSQNAFDLANMFGLQVSRPMRNGMISAAEIDAMEVITSIIKNLIGTSNGENCVYSIPANPIDSDTNIIFHEGLFGRIVEKLGYKPNSLNEATAVVYSEAADTNFSAIGISFGAGMTNIAVVYKSIPAISFSIARGGDWIDQQVATWTGAVQNRITKIKETELDLANVDYADEKNKKKRNVKRALNQYYRSLINYAYEKIISELSKIEVDLPEELPLIISGGTSKVKGFIKTSAEIIDNYEFPFEISEVRQASDPMSAVAQGCLVKALKL